MAERIRLTDDLDELLPGDFITIGSQKIEIKPLGIAKLASISRKLKSFGADLVAEGVTWDNCNNKENIVKIAVVLLDKFPEVLEEASNIHVDDLKRLPPDITVELLDKVLEVNLKSRNSLEKNFLSLIEKLGQAKSVTETKKKK